MTDNQHWNSPSFYPPIGVWLIIDHPERGQIRVKRPEEYSHSLDDVVYLTESDEQITGALPWRYD